jgi:hypothetical protein
LLTWSTIHMQILPLVGLATLSLCLALVHAHTAAREGDVGGEGRGENQRAGRLKGTYPLEEAEGLGDSTTTSVPPWRRHSCTRLSSRETVAAVIRTFVEATVVFGISCNCLERPIGT